MSKTLKRKLFRHKYQIATKQVPGHVVGTLINPLMQLGARVAPYLSPYAMGLRQAAQPVMQRGAQMAGKIGQTPAAKLAKRAGKAVADSPFAKKLGQTFSVLSVPGAVYSGGKTVADTAMAASDFMEGDVEGAKAKGISAIESGLDTAAQLPFIRPGAYLISKGIKGTGKTGITKLAGKITPEVMKKKPLLSEIPIAAGYFMLPENAEGQEMFDPNKPKTASDLGLSPPTPEDEEQIIDDTVKDATEQNIVSQAEATVSQPDQKQLLVNSENLNKVYGEASDQIQKDKQDVSISDVIKRTEDPELYNEIIGGGQGALARETQIQFDEDFARANARPLREIKLNTGESSLGTAATVAEEQNKDMMSSAALIADYEKKLDERQKQSFDEYKKTYQEMTGDDGTNNYRDMAIFKWAMRMMSAKTSQTGMSGFFDVLGRSSSALADDIMAIDQNEKANARVMAEKYMDYEKAFDATTAANDKNIFVSKLGLAQQIEERQYQDEKQAAQNAFELDKLSKQLNAKAEEARVKRMRELTQADGEGKKYLIEDPNAFLGRRGTTVYFNKNKDPMIYGDYVENGIKRRGLIPYVDDQGLPVMVDKLREVQNNPTLQSKSLNRMKNAAEAMRYSRTVKEIVRKHGTDMIGLSGELQVLYGKLTDTLSQVPGVGPKLSRALGGTNANDYVTGRQGSEFLDFDQVNNSFVKSLGSLTVGDGLDAAEAAKTAADLEKLYGKDWERKNSEAVIRMYNEDMKKVQSEGYINKMARKFKLDDKASDFAEKKRALAELLIIEQRMKYLVAHANKGGDRLAVSDIRNAAERTQIFPIFGDRGLVLKNYESFGDEMRTVMNTEFERYLSNGGDESVIPLMFKDNEWVIESQDKGAQLRGQSLSKEDATDALKNTGVIQ
jgi:hypothetical protein